MQAQTQFPKKSPFLHQLNAHLERNLSDPELDVKKILRSIGMSRTRLHEKLKNMAGMSTTEYVRLFRLKKAKKLLLENPEWTIYQVALEVGFRNHCYFTKKFKEVFDCCPKEVKWAEVVD